MKIGYYNVILLCLKKKSVVQLKINISGSADEIWIETMN